MQLLLVLLLLLGLRVQLLNQLEAIDLTQQLLLKLFLVILFFDLRLVLLLVGHRRSLRLLLHQ